MSLGACLPACCTPYHSLARRQIARETSLSEEAPRLAWETLHGDQGNLGVWTALSTPIVPSMGGSVEYSVRFRACRWMDGWIVL